MTPVKSGDVCPFLHPKPLPYFHLPKDLEYEDGDGVEIKNNNTSLPSQPKSLQPQVRLALREKGTF